MEVRNVTIDSTLQSAVNVNTAPDDEAPAQKRQRMQTSGLPCNSILAEVTDILTGIRCHWPSATIIDY